MGAPLIHCGRCPTLTTYLHYCTVMMASAWQKESTLLCTVQSMPWIYGRMHNKKTTQLWAIRQSLKTLGHEVSFVREKERNMGRLSSQLTTISKRQAKRDSSGLFSKMFSVNPVESSRSPCDAMRCRPKAVNQIGQKANPPSNVRLHAESLLVPLTRPSWRLVMS